MEIFANFSTQAQNGVGEVLPDTSQNSVGLLFSQLNTTDLYFHFLIT